MLLSKLVFLLLMLPLIVSLPFRLPPLTPTSSFSSSLLTTRLYHRGSNNKQIRLDRLLSNRGPHTRSQITTLIKTRRVTSLDGTEIFNSPKIKVSPSTIFKVNNIISKPLPYILKFNKPKNVLTSIGPNEKNHFNRSTLDAYKLPEQYEGKYHPVGRLDYETSGLLLWSLDGDITHKILSPSSEIQKVYSAKVNGVLSDVNLLVDRIENEGVQTSEGLHFGKIIQVVKNEKDMDVKLSITEGKHRQIRRMLFNAMKGELEDPDVLELKRVKVGEVELGELEEGEFIEVLDEEKEWVESLL